MKQLTKVAFTTALASAIWVFPSLQKVFDGAVSAETFPASNSILVAQSSAIDLQQIQQTIQQNPQLIQQLAPQILQQNPQLIQQLEENPELVRQILQQTQPLVQQLQQNPQLIQQLQQQIKK